MCSPGQYNKWISRQLVRIGFGLALLFTGIAHYRSAADFALSVGNGLGPTWLVGLGTTWGYILPLLMILGGLCLALNLFSTFGVMAAGLALASIPAGLMLKSAMSGISLGDTMPPTMNAFIWILVYMYAVKGTKRCCGSGEAGCETASSCCTTPCDCSTESAAPVKSAPVVKAVPKKVVAKKAAVKKTVSKM